MIPSKTRSCSFFGHRNVLITKNLKSQLFELIENLIVNYNVSIFLFGSRSTFDFICHLVVTELKERYPNIKRIAYTCKNETCTLEKERKKLEQTYSYFNKQKIRLLGVEEEYNFKNKYVARKSSYIQRNQAMINNSDFCIFYYDKNYKPPLKKYSKKCVSYYQPQSGTNLAYTYAQQKNKIIINIAKSS